MDKISLQEASINEKVVEKTSSENNKLIKEAVISMPAESVKDGQKKRNKQVLRSNSSENKSGKRTNSKIPSAAASTSLFKTETSEDISEQLVAKLRIEEEILWCIKDISNKIESKKLDRKTEAKYYSALRTLENKTAPLPKKRQLMHSLCGNYKSKMDAQTESAFSEKEINSGMSSTGTFLAFARKKSPSWMCESDSTEKFTFNFPES